MPLSIQIILGAGAMIGTLALYFYRESATLDRADRLDAAAMPNAGSNESSKMSSR